MTECENGRKLDAALDELLDSEPSRQSRREHAAWEAKLQRLFEADVFAQAAAKEK